MDELIGELSRSSLFTLANKTVVLQPSSEEERRQGVELIGTIVDSKYKITQLLGSGGMGSVYLARHLMLDKDVALKTFKSASLTQEEKQRFQREAQAIAKLSNANIIEVFDFGYVDGEVPYYTMERLVGQSLRQQLDNCNFLALEEALSIFIQVCRGLSAAHKKGIIHRDLKPDNIFLQELPKGSSSTQTKASTVKIVDFGIAALTVSPSETQKLTAIGTIFGSPLYMSPEQSMGLPVSESSDIYSLGCALFQTLVGKPPFVGTNALTTLLMHQSAPIPNLKTAMNGRECPQALEELLATMLAKSPELRYQNIEEVLEAMLHIEKMSQLGLKNLSDNAVKKDYVKNDYRRDESHSAVNDREEEDEEEEEEDASEEAHSSIASKKLIVVLSVAFTIILSIALLAYAYVTKADHAEKTIPPPAAIDGVNSAATQPTAPAGFFDLNTISSHQKTELKKRLLHPDRFSRLAVPEHSVLSPEELELIANTRWIKYLTAISCEFDNQSLVILKKMNLIKINLCKTKLDDQGAKVLSSFQTLDEIKAEHTLITNAGVRELASLRKLATLRLSSTKVDADGIRYLCTKNRNCTTIYLAHCNKITPEEIGKLSQEFRQVKFITNSNAH